MLTGIQLFNIAAHYCLHLHSSGSPTLEAVSNSHQIPKDTNLHQQHCTNMNCHKPTFTVLSVTDIRTAFNCCCSFNWKRRTDGNFKLRFITSALNTREFLGSRPRCFISGEQGQYTLTTRLCGSQSQSGCLEKWGVSYFPGIEVSQVIDAWNQGRISWIFKNCVSYMKITIWWSSVCKRNFLYRKINLRFQQTGMGFCARC